MIGYGRLRDYFSGVSVKRLSAVDSEPARSNQHEVSTTQAMREQFLGNMQKQQFPAIYIWLDEDLDSIIVNDTATHYDVREQKLGRKPEWRLYYSANSVTDAMREGDTLFLALNKKGVLYFIVAPEASIYQQQLLWLFGLTLAEPTFVSRSFTGSESELSFAAGLILEEIGITPSTPESGELDEIVSELIKTYGENYPRTAELSKIVRRNVPDVRAEEDPDYALVTWLYWEKILFQKLDDRIVGKRLIAGFVDKDKPDISGFYEYSKSAINRKKSRMGYSLEHHIEAVFQACNVTYARGAITEDSHKPDFLFPTAKAYRLAPDSGHSCLTMLGVKSSCRDRWRQILTEADKIPRKHLFTLESRISESQTNQMKNSNLQLVVPQSIRKDYEDRQQTWLWSLAEFIKYVQDHNRLADDLKLGVGFPEQC